MGREVASAVKYSDLEGKVALVTGGTGGVGYRIAEKLAQNRATVIINGRSEERGVLAVRKLATVFNRVQFIPGDTRQYQDLVTMVEAAVEFGGGLDILISAGSESGIGPRPFAEMTVDQMEAGIRDRLYPRLFTVHAALPSLCVKGGAVVFLTTDAARQATPGESVIGAVGAGVIMLTKVLAKELSQYQIRVNSVALTLTSDTPSWDRIFSGAGFQRDLFSRVRERFPFGRPPNADEVASVAVFLTSASASQVTGQTISVNGGLSFGGW